MLFALYAADILYTHCNLGMTIGMTLPSTEIPNVSRQSESTHPPGPCLIKLPLDKMPPTNAEYITRFYL